MSPPRSCSRAADRAPRPAPRGLLRAAVLGALSAPHALQRSVPTICALNGAPLKAAKQYSCSLPQPQNAHGEKRKNKIRGNLTEGMGASGVGTLSPPNFIYLKTNLRLAFDKENFVRYFLWTKILKYAKNK